MPKAGLFASARVEPIAATFRQSAVTAADLTVYAFAAQPIGSPSPTRRVVVAVACSSTRSVVSASIGGVAASIDAGFTLAGTGRVGIISAVVPDGETADVVVTLNGSSFGAGIGVWTLTGGAPTGQTDDGSGDPIALAVTTTPGAVVIAYAFTSGAGTALFAWTGATERFEEDVYSTTTTHSGADTAATGSSTEISVDVSAATSVGVAAAYA